MLYTEFAGKKISRLGFGAMRLPLLENGGIDEAQVDDMVAACMDSGINYFDTAYPYHNGLSEILLARSLKRYPRESYFLATKYPGHQISNEYDPADIFEEQLRKCQVDYFDFYLLHNVYERSLPVYLDPQWGIIDYFVEQKRLGRIKHLGFSTHGGMDCLRAFLDAAGEHMEFCQIQMNYLDWTLQQADEKVELLAEHNLPVWVMETVRGGSLCKLGDADMSRLREADSARSAAQWALQWHINKPGSVILTGASSLEQLQENIAVFNAGTGLTADEDALLASIAEGMMDSVPCTACRYCCSSCPQELDIPYLMSLANEVRVAPSFNVGMRIDALEEGKQPQDCIECGACAEMCPQNIEIPQVLADMVATQAPLPHWDDLCKARYEAAQKLREQD